VKPSIKKPFTISIIFISLIFPYMVKNEYYQHIINITLLFTISVYALNIMTGLIGQINIAHAGFIGLGAYITALATTKMGFSFWVAMPLAGLIAAIGGFMIGYPALRVRGHYFALTTLALGEIFYLIFDNWIGVTGGPMGIVGIPSPSPIKFPNGFSIAFDSRTTFYYLLLFFVFVSIYITRELLYSRLGRAMIGIRENEDLAQSIGISIPQTKVVAFVLSTFLCGISGSLFAAYFKFISPVSFTLEEMFRILTMLVIGGSGTLFGPLIGTFIFTALPEFLRSVEDFQWIAYGLILMIFVSFMPEGIVGYLKKRIAAKEESN
jgi:branched-chain amino acid transport system permease protein